MANPPGLDVSLEPPRIQGGKLKISNVPLGSIALASMGTNTTGVIQLWMTDIWVPVNRFVTKVGFLQGGTATTDKAAATIYSPAGALLASSPVAGTTLSGANTFLELTITLDGAGNTITGLQMYGPSQYYIGIQLNGTTAGDIQTVASPYLDICAGAVAAGVFGTFPATITTPNSFTTATAPFVYIY